MFLLSSEAKEDALDEKGIYDIVSRLVMGEEPHYEYGLKRTDFNRYEEWEEAVIFHGISTNRADVERLVERLGNEVIDTENLGYIIEDYVNELAMC